MNFRNKARMIAEKAHANQTYDDIYPYMYHINEVVAVAKNHGLNQEIIIACYLHDTIEDTTITYNDIKGVFGKEVAEIVYAVTDELGRNRKERKDKTYSKLVGNTKAIAVKLCDRIANMRHSLESHSSMYTLYTKELQGFKDTLHVDHEETNHLWKTLENI